MYLLLVIRAIIMLLIVILSVPGALLNAPLGLISRYLSIREARRALSKSEVKVKAKDVVASYKVLVAIVVALLPGGSPSTASTRTPETWGRSPRSSA